MRFSAVTALCAAPLALAGTLQSELVARGEVGLEESGLLGGNVIVDQPIVQITEVIIIWSNSGGGAPTQTINEPSSFALTTTTSNGVETVASAAAATHSVTVGGTAGLVYTPDTIEANIGDMVIFTFLEQNHTASQSAFTTPCDLLAGGMDSGFMPNLNSSVTPPPQMAMQVTVATPLWFFCRQTGHCGKGMTFSINPTVNKTQAMFQAMAIAQNGTALSTAVIAGGTGASSTAAVAGSASTSSANTGSIVSGTGSFDSSGNCDCSCACAQGSFPSINQGIGAFGGMSGQIPTSLLLTT